MDALRCQHLVEGSAERGIAVMQHVTTSPYAAGRLVVNQKVAKAILKKGGHSVTLAGNGQEALDTLDRCGWPAFDLVLMDIQMPLMDGLAATAAIRERERANGLHLPVIALTAHNLEGDAQCCLRAGMDGYASRPIGPTDLYASIRSALKISAE